MRRDQRDESFVGEEREKAQDIAEQKSWGTKFFYRSEGWKSLDGGKKVFGRLKGGF